MPTIERIEWSDALCTGVDEIDRQHRILVQVLGEAEALLAEERHGRRFEQIFRDLLAYAIYHFETEEELMRRHGYDRAGQAAADAHLAQHRGFSERVVALRAEARHNDRASREALVAFLRDWLVNHITTTDRILGRFILGAAPAQADASAPAAPACDAAGH
jgi:hemerythrin-like metal-binding protein